MNWRSLLLSCGGGCLEQYMLERIDVEFSFFLSIEIRELSVVQGGFVAPDWINNAA